MNGSSWLGWFGAKDLGWQARAIAVALGLALAACSSPAASEHEGHGTAVEIDHEARTITLDHEDIPGLMKGMTMTFAVASGVDLNRVEAGSEVAFVLQDADNALTVTRIQPRER